MLEKLVTSDLNRTLSKYDADPILLDANEDQLWGALACLDEGSSDYEKLQWLKLDRKLRTLLWKKEVEEERKHRRMMDRRYWAPLIVAMLGVIVGILVALLK
ncbi:MAG: hypothetical protein ABSA45_03250 [Verrucomicrobiota bacterium]